MWTYTYITKIKNNLIEKLIHQNIQLSIQPSKTSWLQQIALLLQSNNSPTKFGTHIFEDMNNTILACDVSFTWLTAEYETKQEMKWKKTRLASVLTKCQLLAQKHPS